MIKIYLFIILLSTFVYIPLESKAGNYNSIDQDIIFICGEYFPPYAYMDDNGETKGIEIDVISHILKKMEVRFEFKILPWARCWTWLKSGKADIGLTTSKKEERFIFVDYPNNSIWNSNFVLFVNKKVKSHTNVQNMQDIVKNNLKVGAVRWNSYSKEFWAPFTSKKDSLITYINDIEVGFKMLQINRIDVFPSDEKIGNSVISRIKYNGNIDKYNFNIFKKEYFNVFSKKSSFINKKYVNILQLKEEYDLELSEFKKTQEFQDITSKYMIEFKL